MSKYMGYNGKRSLKTWVTSHFLGKTDCAADTALLGGKPPEYYAGPVNLLDNYDFKIAQAGYGGMHGAVRYAADRWKVDGYSVAASRCDGALTIAGTSTWSIMNQVLHDDARQACRGQRVTLAVYLASGYIACAQYDIPASGSFDTPGINLENSWAANVFASGDEICVRVYNVTNGDGLRIKRVLLLTGGYTLDTLPPYTPRPYSVELAECQRYYYQTWDGPTPATINGLIVREAITDARLGGNITFPVEMRITPTITFYNLSGTPGVWKEWINDTPVSMRAIYCNTKSFMASAYDNSASKATAGLHYTGHYCASAEL